MPSAVAVCEVVISAPDATWLSELCTELVTTGLAASAHVAHPIVSVYRWKGVIRNATEARAWLRTRESLVESVTDFVCVKHPYETPNVTAFRIVDGNHDYLHWILDETSGPR
jgi:periplasmic divalent cation tolerance protein